MARSREHPLLARLAVHACRTSWRGGRGAQGRGLGFGGRGLGPGRGGRQAVWTHQIMAPNQNHEFSFSHLFRIVNSASVV